MGEGVFPFSHIYFINFFMEAKDLDMDAIQEESLVKAPELKNGRQVAKKVVKTTTNSDGIEYNAEGKPLINCLRNVRVEVKLIPKTTGLVQSLKHILGGGMADNSVRRFTVPVYRSGKYKNVLSPSEKTYLEHIMGLEVDALSVYRKHDNFWSNYMVRLEKYDNYLDLSVPEDYIKYKVLLANKDYIAASPDVQRDYPKATYQYVIIEEGAQEAEKQTRISLTEKCYEKYGEIKNDVDVLRVVVETISGRSTTPNQKLNFLQGKCYDFIQNNPSEFLKVVTDEFLSTKVLIKRAIDLGIIYRKGNYYYLRDDNSPLCGQNQEPILQVACAYLNLPKNSQLKLSIEGRVNGVN